MSVRKSAAYRITMVVLSLACLGGAGFLVYRTYFAARSPDKLLVEAKKRYGDGAAAEKAGNPADAATAYAEAAVHAENGVKAADARVKAGTDPEDAKKLLGELCLLHAVKLEGGDYEWVQHVPIALDLGATQPQIDALAKGDDKAACFSALEQAALTFTREVVVNAKASEMALSAVRKHLSEREVVELILMSGFYITLARLTETLGVENDPPMGRALIRGIEKRVSAKKG